MKHRYKHSRGLLKMAVKGNYGILLANVGIAVVSIIAIIVAFVFYIGNVETFVTGLVYSRIEESCSAHGKIVSNYVDARMTAAKNVASVVRAEHQTGSGNEGKYFVNSQSYIDRYLDENPVSEINFIEQTRAGDISIVYNKRVLSGASDSVLQPVTVRPYYDECFDGKSRLDFRKEDGTVAILIPLYSESAARPFAVMEAVYDNAIFATKTSDVDNLSDGATLFVLDESGDIINDRDFSVIGSESDNLFFVLTYASFADGNNVDGVVEKYKAGEDLTVGFSLDGSGWHGFFVDIGHDGWHAFLLYNDAVLEDAIDRMITLTWIVEGVTLFVFAMVLASIIMSGMKKLLKLLYDNKQLQGMFSNIPGGSIVARNDEDLTISSINDGYAELLGLQKGDFKAKYDNKLMNVIFPDDRETVRFALKGQLAHSNLLELQYRVVRSDGKVLWLLSQGKLSINALNGEEAIFWVVIDITDTKATRELLAKTNEDFISLTNTIPGGVVKIAFNDNLDFEYANNGFYQTVGYSADIIKSRFSAGLYKLILPEDRESVMKNMLSQLKVSASIGIEFRLQTANGTMWVMLKGQKQFDEKGNVDLLCVLSDITEIKSSAKLIEREREKYKTIAKLSDDTLLEYNLTNDTLSLTGNTLRGGTKFVSSFLKTLDSNGFIYAKDIPLLRRHIQAISENYEVEDIELRVRFDNKEPYTWVSASAVLKDDFMVGKLVDINKAKIEAETLKDLARRDPLTGLYNKTATETYIDHYLKSVKDSRAIHALMVLDIDNFKDFNDTLGHLVGDEVLKAISLRALTLFRSTDLLGRVGGDEFCFFAKDFSNEQSVLEKARELCDVLSSLSFGDKHHSLTVSIGIAIYGSNGKTYEAMFSAADKALYKAKEKGKNVYHLAESSKK